MQHDRHAHPCSKSAVTASSMAKTVTFTSCAPLPQMYLLAEHIHESLSESCNMIGREMKNAACTT